MPTSPDIGRLTSFSGNLNISQTRWIFIGCICEDIFGIPTALTRQTFPSLSTRGTSYTKDSRYCVCAPMVSIDSLMLFPFNPTCLANLSVMKDKVLPPSQKMFTKLEHPFEPAVSHASCICNMVLPAESLLV